MKYTPQNNRPPRATAVETAAALLREGRAEEALACLRQAHAKGPDEVRALNLMGTACHRLKRYEEAAAYYEQAAARQPGNVAIRINLGNALVELRRYDHALAAFRKAAKLQPALAGAQLNIGLVLRQLSRLAEARDHLAKAVVLDPGFAQAHYHLATVLNDLGRQEEALASLDTALKIEPDLAEAHLKLGLIRNSQGWMSQAEASFRRAQELKPDLVEARDCLGNNLIGQGRVAEAAEHFRRTLALQPARAVTRSNLLFALNYLPDQEREGVFREHREYARIHEAPLAREILPNANDRDPSRRLRLGYVSGDFWRHSVSYFLEPVLACHDHRQFEVYCYSSGTREDEVTQRLRGHTDVWRSIVNLTDAEAARRIRDDGIDILVDLAGHTAHNRLAAFARRPAPVQVTWLGYPNTTGLAATDYRLTDAWADPPGSSEDFHSEQIVHLPSGFLCYRPFEDAPEVAPPPCERKGHVTFGSFNVIAKITPAVVALWSQVLHAVPGARMMLKSLSFRDREVRERYMSLFADHGIPGERLDLRCWTPDTREHLALYHEVDIALDTFPYNGTTTSCEALWMGVPVVTLAGDRHAGRVGASLLHGVGMDELVADSPQAYRQLAADLAGDPRRLAACRADLRSRMRQAPLTDAAGFMRSIEAAFRDMWRRWCERESGAGEITGP